MFFDYSNYYYLVIALQAFCIYHSHKNNNGQKWYWVIIFLPLVGSLIYLYENFYSRRNVSNVVEASKGIFNSNYNLNKLEKAVKFSGTYTNKSNLANAYIERDRYEEAIQLLESCRNGIYEDNKELIGRLADAYFLNKDYKKVIELYSKFEPIGDDKVIFAKALILNGDSKRAEEILKNMGGRFSNYSARITYANLLINTGRTPESKEILNQIIEEYDVMSNYEKNLKRKIVNEAKTLLKSIK